MRAEAGKTKGVRSMQRKSQTYRRKLGGTEACSAIKPVIVAQLVDLDALLVLMRHRLCHHRGLGIVPRDSELATVADQIGDQVEMLLQGQLRRLGLVEDGKRRHGALRNCAPQTTARVRLFGEATAPGCWRLGQEMRCGAVRARGRWTRGVQLVLEAAWEVGSGNVVGNCGRQRSAAQRCGVSILSGK